MCVLVWTDCITGLKSSIGLVRPLTIQVELLNGCSSVQVAALLLGKGPFESDLAHRTIFGGR
jgi:hypothetical protein